ncbi:MAG: hypothetical protein LQ351_005912 [Letrouitia transgressa]|nr:MAG: hypothetical protein LQ351_005912 [Letrouitia transgressa]
MSSPEKPKVLLLGDITHAHAEWNALSAIAELHVSQRLRASAGRVATPSPGIAIADGLDPFSKSMMETEISFSTIANLGSMMGSLQFRGLSIPSRSMHKRVPIADLPGIAVSNTPGAVDASTANTAIYLLLGALRRAHLPATALREGKWRGSMGLGHDPEGKVLGILGLGGIGSALALRAAPFDFQIQYHNRNPIQDPSRNPTNAKYVSFEELLRTSDVISIHLPLSDATRGIVGTKEFSMMKDGVVIVNTARGAVMDESALVDALDQGKVFAAGLDVYENEPEVHPGLIRNDNVLLLPHVGTATVETQYKMEVLVIENVKSAVVSGHLITPVIETRQSKL